MMPEMVAKELSLKRMMSQKVTPWLELYLARRKAPKKLRKMTIKKKMIPEPQPNFHGEVFMTTIDIIAQVD
jgi:hypothetical protein